MVEAGGIEPPSETEPPKLLRAYPPFGSRPGSCPEAGHFKRQRPRGYGLGPGHPGLVRPAGCRGPSQQASEVSRRGGLLGREPNVVVGV